MFQNVDLYFCQIFQLEILQKYIIVFRLLCKHIEFSFLYRVCKLIYFGFSLVICVLLGFFLPFKRKCKNCQNNG